MAVWAVAQAKQFLQLIPQEAARGASPGTWGAPRGTGGAGDVGSSIQPADSANSGEMLDFGQPAAAV